VEFAGRDGSVISHLPALDGVRGIAILLVVGMHFGVGAGVPDPWRRFLYVGWCGVDLFFVLSGFLITSILLDSRVRPRYFVNFYGRRVLRIMPLYFGAVVLGVLVLPSVWPGWSAHLASSRSDSWWLWTYTANVGLSLGLVQSFGAFGHFWTLAIEEQFYLVWPLLVKMLSTRRLMVLCSTLTVTGLVLRWVWMGYIEDWGGAYRFTLTRLDALAVGASVAVFVRSSSPRERGRVWARGILVVSGGLLLGLFLLIDPFYPSHAIVVTIGHTLLAAAFGALVLLVVGQSDQPDHLLHRWLEAGWLRSWGRYSYGIYVLHYPLLLVLLPPYAAWDAAGLPAWHALRAVLFLVGGGTLAFVTGWLSYLLFERHFLRLKWRFAYDLR
jgi:peptidoglycan/LPS O-acetylase OafA/YrhL